MKANRFLVLALIAACVALAPWEMVAVAIRKLKAHLTSTTIEHPHGMAFTNAAILDAWIRFTNEKSDGELRRMIDTNSHNRFVYEMKTNYITLQYIWLNDACANEFTNWLKKEPTHE